MSGGEGPVDGSAAATGDLVMGTDKFAELHAKFAGRFVSSLSAIAGVLVAEFPDNAAFQEFQKTMSDVTGNATKQSELLLLWQEDMVSTPGGEPRPQALYALVSTHAMVQFVNADCWFARATGARFLVESAGMGDDGLWDMLGTHLTEACCTACLDALLPQTLWSQYRALYDVYELQVKPVVMTILRGVFPLLKHAGVKDILLLAAYRRVLTAAGASIQLFGVLGSDFVIKIWEQVFDKGVELMAKHFGAPLD